MDEYSENEGIPILSESPQGENINGDTRDSNSDIHSSLSAPTVILCICMKTNKLAASSFNCSTHEVNLLESTYDCNSDFITTYTVYQQVQPNIVIISTRVPRRLLKVLVHLIEEDDRKSQVCVSLFKLPPKAFNYAACKSRILSVEMGGPLIDLKGEDKKNFILAAINISDERLVSAFGAVLYFLNTEFRKLGLGECDNCIHAIKNIEFDKITWIDEETYRNLQVFDPIQHPSTFKWSNKKDKEGLSMLNLIERHCSQLGIPYLRTLMAKPTNDINILSGRHEIIAFFNSPSNIQTVQTMKSYMSRITSLSVLMSNLLCPHVRGGHWQILYQNIYYSVLTAEICKTNSEASCIFKKIGGLLTHELYAMAHHIDRIIDFEAMERQDLFVVKEGVYDSLDQAKDKYINLIETMDEIVPYEFDNVPLSITQLRLTYVPELKFVLSIPFWKENLTEEDLELPNLEFKFTANGVAYYKSMRCRELDEILGDPQIDIMEEESNIIQELSRYLSKKIHYLIVLIKEIIELDCIFALASVAKQYNYTKPEIIDERKIEMYNTRHPLLETCLDSFIPNNYVSTSDSSLIKLIYGPNASGKTVFLKQVALIVYLAHIGSYVPAERACIGVLHRIDIRIHKSESIAMKSSSFMNDLKYISTAVSSCRPSSLIVLDEFGKGTTELNAVSIMAACIEFLESKKDTCPHILISTHFQSIIENFPVSPLLSVHKMSIAIEDGKVIFLYKLQADDSDHGYTLDTIKNSCSSENIKNTAKGVLRALRTGEGVYPYSYTRIARSRKSVQFLRRFVIINIEKEGYIEKLRSKVERICRETKTMIHTS